MSRQTATTSGTLSLSHTMAPLLFRLGILIPLVLAVLAYPTTIDHVSDPFSDPLDDGPSPYQLWRASRERARERQASVWTVQEEQVMIQLGMKRRVEAFANWLNPWGEGQITVFVSSFPCVSWIWS
jgi:hypothetical protein